MTQKESVYLERKNLQSEINSQDLDNSMTYTSPVSYKLCQY